MKMLVFIWTKMFQSCVKIQSDMKERANVHRNKKKTNSEMLTVILALPGKVAHAGEQCLQWALCS